MAIVTHPLMSCRLQIGLTVPSMKPKQLTRGGPFWWMASAYCCRQFWCRHGTSKLAMRCRCLFHNKRTVSLMISDKAYVGLPKKDSGSHRLFGYKNSLNTIHSASTRVQTQPFDTCITAGRSNRAVSLTMSFFTNLKFTQHWSSVSVSMSNRGQAKYLLISINIMLYFPSSTNYLYGVGWPCRWIQ